MQVDFDGLEVRSAKIMELLVKYNINDLKEAQNLCIENGIDVEKEIKKIQPIAFDNAIWAYIAGCAIAIKQKCKTAINVCSFLGEALQAFCIKGSVAERRECGLGHGNLGAKLLNENTKCFCFITGHESFAAAEGAVGLALSINKSRKTPLKILILGLGKEAAYIISRVKGFTYIETEFDYNFNTIKEISKREFSKDERANVLVFGVDSVMEGVEVCKKYEVDVSITGNSTNPVRFQHPVAGTYKNWCCHNNKEYFSIASGGGTGRTLHPDNMAAGPISYGLTDTMGRMHCDAQFAGSSSVPAHVNMMGFIGMGNNPMVGATIKMAVLIEELNL